jgi:HSP20 family protein
MAELIPIPLTRRKTIMRIIKYYPNTRSFVPAYGLSARSLLTGLESEIDRLVSGAAGFVADFPVDLQEDKDNAYVRAELPGVKREDLKVETADGALTISASRKQKDGENETAVALSRSVSLPADVQVDKVTAAYENGVLTVTLPKAEALRPRQIEIK